MPHQHKGTKQRRCVGPDSQKWAALEEILEEMASEDDATRKHLSTIKRQLSHILTLLQPIATELHDMSGELDALTAEVTANTDAEAAAVVLLGKLHDLLVAAGTDPAKLSALTAQLASSKDDLAAAIVANTPAEG